ncbi:hypothetical protein KVT40_005105 [Elsinoe batatas]|uniref:Dipeptidyl peptidase 3 n=1 Tax=Elsinoe batatas TaxID=2601811 RepID=A0A8K0L1Z3_9PEZI|nr:hypothetical protein KVT40_005105 [Elsinoe batatas]
MGLAEHFDSLTKNEKLYAHHAARAAWYGTPIIFEQVSEEAAGIFRFIMSAFHLCAGDWKYFAALRWINEDDLDHFLNYSATFLSNMGNFYGSGDSKFIPAVPSTSLEAFAARSEQLRSSLAPIVDAMYAVPPYSLGFPGNPTTSAYYPGAEQISQEEIAMVSQELQKHSIYLENTRIRKVRADNDFTFEVLQASVDPGLVVEFTVTGRDYRIKLLRGDHSQALRKVCGSWEEAIPHAASDWQREYIKEYVQSFRTGDLNIYREALKKWVRHLSPTVEDIFGFGLVAIKDVQATELVTRLVDMSDTFITSLGPFEKSLFDPPDFTCIHTLSYCSSILFGGINLPNYNDLRQEYGFKNVIISNRMSAESSDSLLCPFVDEDELARYQRHRYAAYYTWVVLHELLGHGTSQLLAETAPGVYNFDINHPPISPLTNSAVMSWFKYGETWTSCFEDLSTTVDECRAELVGAYLMDDKELLALFGYTDDTSITADDVTYNLYMQQGTGTDGLRALADYNIDSGRWGQDH